MSSALLTLPAMRGSIVLGNPSWLFSLFVFHSRYKIPLKWVGKKPQQLCFERHPAVWSFHPHPRGSSLTWRTVNRRRLRVLCAHLRRVQQCPLPPTTAFPQSQRFHYRTATEIPEFCLTSAHLLWRSSMRGWRPLTDTCYSVDNAAVIRLLILSLF